MAQERICGDLAWERVSSEYGTGIFNPASEGLLDRIGIGHSIRAGNARSIAYEHLGRVVGEGACSTVYAVREHPDTLIKISEYEELPDMQVNIALGHALATTQYDTPEYHAFLPMRSGDHMTVMARSPRRSVKDLLALDGKAWTKEEKAVLWRHVQDIGASALEGVGFNLRSIKWDLHPGNLLADICPDSPEAACQVPLTIIDQQALSHDARPWDNQTRAATTPHTK